MLAVRFTAMDLSKILGGREVELLGQGQSRFAQLARLTQDFDLHVLEAVCESSAPNLVQKSFVLVTARHQQTDQTALTPSFSSLAELEQHVASNITDILDDYLFDQVMTETERNSPVSLSALA